MTQCDPFEEQFVDLFVIHPWKSTAEPFLEEGPGEFGERERLLQALRWGHASERVDCRLLSLDRALLHATQVYIRTVPMLA